MRNLAALVVLGFLIAGCGTVGVSPLPLLPPPPFPFPAGTTWTYRHTSYTPPPCGRGTLVGTLTQIYRGTLTYRGATYHASDESSTLSPGRSGRTYFTWNPVARTAANVRTEAWGTLETIYSNPFLTIGATESLSGTIWEFVNGTSREARSYSVSTASAGTFIVTVPAGTFTTTRWDSNWPGAVTTNASSYAVGNASVVRVDSHPEPPPPCSSSCAMMPFCSTPSAFLWMALFGTYSLELVSGPVAAGTSASKALSRAGLGAPPLTLFGGDVNRVRQSLRDR